MNPQFFGRDHHSLFGVYHPPKAARARTAGVVLCYPFGQEYMRSHRAFRQLARLLAGAGFHVMRFDYSGTGDSSGEATDARLSDWVKDAGAAADELRDSSGVERIVFVGLRLGAAIAALAADGRPDVAQVVLWDPVVDGSAFVSELSEAADPPPSSPVAGVGTVGVLGFPLTSALRGDLAALDIRRCGAPAGSGRYLVISEPSGAYTSLAAVAFDDVEVRVQHVPAAGNWNEVDDFGGVLIPVAVIQAIVAHLSEVVA